VTKERVAALAAELAKRADRDSGVRIDDNRAAGYLALDDMRDVAALLAWLVDDDRCMRCHRCYDVLIVPGVLVPALDPRHVTDEVCADCAKEASQ